jgi:hypothetical protein
MTNLLEFRFDKYTSTGNDGIIEQIFETLGVKEGFFVEFGAWDGLHGCNCRKLCEEGWSGIFIEPILRRYLKLYWNYRRNRHVRTIWSMVSTEGKNRFDCIMDRCSVNFEIDFCSIDIDGPDVDVFETFENHLPKVVCIEGGQMLHPLHDRIPSEVANNNIQQSLSVIVEIGRKKGYKPVCSYQDTFLVKKKLYDKFGVTGDLVRMYFDGLKAHHRRLPWIQKKLREVNMLNPIVDDILSKAGFEKYSFHKRKQWAVDVKDIIGDIIEERYVLETKHT